MSRVFNLLIQHQEKSYPALLTIAGDLKESSQVRVSSTDGKIEIVLPNGTLKFSTAEVLKTLFRSGESPSCSVMHITPSITLQLLANNW